MANTPRQQQLDFIDSNPATDAFQKGQILHQQEMAREIAAEGQMLQNVETRAAAPSRLRTVNANANTAETNAYVQGQTADSKITSEKANASKNVADASVATQTVGTRVAQEGARLRSANAAAVTAEMQGFHESLKLLNAGQTEAALEVARRTGQTIPQEVINNSEVRLAVTRAAKLAEENYPNRPKDQQSFMTGFLKDMADRKANGEPINDPRTPYQVQGIQPARARDQRQAEHTGRDRHRRMARCEWRCTERASCVGDGAAVPRQPATDVRDGLQQRAAQSWYQAKAKKTADDFMATINQQGVGAPRPRRRRPLLEQLQRNQHQLVPLRPALPVRRLRSLPLDKARAHRRIRRNRKRTSNGSRRRRRPVPSSS